MKKTFLAILFLLFVFCGISFAAEEITITTYYPSPYGSYDQLTANDMKIGSGYSASSFVNDGLIVQGNVGIGTATPSQKLMVNGAIEGTSYRVGGTAGWNGSMTVRDNGGASDCTITVTNGIITASSC